MEDSAAMTPRRIVDTHTHPMVDARQQVMADAHPPEDYLSRIAGMGFEGAAALVIAPRDDLELTGSLNDVVLSLGHDHDGFFYPVCTVHPGDGGAALEELGFEDELERIFHADAEELLAQTDAR